MKKLYLFMTTLLLLTGCMDNTPKQKLDGAELLTQKCASCHNLDMPPKNYDNEIAPSLMAVTFHLKDFITSSNPSEHKSKIISFVKDYVVNPTAEKSICDKSSLETYGLMPSQKGKVTDDEVEAMVEYMYEYYDNKKMLEKMAEENRIKNLAVHERVIELNGCSNCHDMEKDKVAPSFKMISDRYEKKDREMLIKSIKEGSKGKWENKKLPMPAYKKIEDKDIEGVVDWLLK